MGAARGFKRFVLVLPLLLLGSLVAATMVRADPAAADGAPTRLNPWKINSSSDMLGLRDLARTPTIQPPMSVTWDNLPDDPPFVAPLQGYSSCDARDATPLSVGYHASWFEVTANANGEPIPERSIVTVDTGNSAFTGMIAVYDGTVPPPFNPAVPAITQGPIACDVGLAAGGATSLAVPAIVSFVAHPTRQYFVEVASQINFRAASALYLYLSVLDAQPPAVQIKTDDQNQAQPGESMVFNVGWPDAGSGIDLSSITAHATTTGLSGSPVITLKARAPLGGIDGCPTLGLGEYCLAPAKQTLTVRWPAGATIVKGRVDLAAADLAGNLGTASLTLTVRDRTPPMAKFKKLKSVGRTATITASCSERGRLHVLLFGPGPDRKAVMSIAAGRTGSLRFTRLRSGFYLIQIQCEDLSKNLGSAFRGLLVR